MKLNNFNNRKVCIVDYELVNIASIENAIKYLGIKYEILKKPKKLGLFSHLILPGVGSFHEAAKKLNLAGWNEGIKEFVSNSKPVLGICLGMQLMFDGSTEDGWTEGMGFFKGKCEAFPKGKFPSPHMGFNLVNHKNTKIWNNIINPSPFYFVHSFRIKDSDNDSIIAKTSYGEDFISFIEKKKCFGAQFHPEKSHKIGLKLLKNFFDEI